MIDYHACVAGCVLSAAVAERSLSLFSTMTGNIDSLFFGSVCTAINNHTLVLQPALTLSSCRRIIRRLLRLLKLFANAPVFYAKYLVSVLEDLRQYLGEHTASQPGVAHERADDGKTRVDKVRFSNHDGHPRF